jgi:hypothetical protein
MAKFKPLVPYGKSAVVGQKRVTSLKLARKLTSKFHSLLASKESLDSTDQQRKAVEAEIVAMGGREAYQAASALATQNYRSSRFVFKSLVKLGLQPKSGELPLRVLEIGAVNSQLRVCPWMRVRAIDLLSRDRGVETKDFFTVPIGSGPTGKSESTYSTSANAPTGSAALELDQLIVPAPSRLRYIDWNSPDPVAVGAASSTVVTIVEKEKSTAVGGEGGGGGSRKRKRTDDEGKDVDVKERVEREGIDGEDAGAANRNRQRRQFFGGDAAAASGNHHSRSSSSPAITGGYDIVVNAMVINCVMVPEKRAEMLVRCRDHLVPGGLLFLALPSRCLDVSENLTRELWEAYLAAIGFSFIDEKRTAKISFYLLRRSDIVATPPSSSPVSSHIKKTTNKNVKSSSSSLSSSSDLSGYGNSWKPVIHVNGPGAEKVLKRLSPPVKLLPKGEMPVTGFTKTKFSLSVPLEWWSEEREKGSH